MSMNKIKKLIKFILYILKNACKRLFLVVLFLNKKQFKIPLSKENVKKILIPCYMGLGDLIYFLPTLEAIKTHFPAAKITMLWDNLSVAKELIDKTDLVHSWIYYLRNQKNPFLWWKINSIIKRNKYDVFIGRQSVYCFPFARGMSNISYRIGHIKVNQKLDTRLFNFMIPFDGKKRIPHNLELLRPLGIIPEQTPCDINLQVSLNSKNKVLQFLKKNDIEIRDYIIAFHVGCGKGQDWKKWGVNNFAKLAERILQYNKLIKIILIGGKLEEDDAVAFAIQFPNSRIVNAVNIFSLNETIALVNSCNLCVIGDSGLSKIAYALNVSTIVIYGPTNPELVSHGGSEIVVRSNRCCAPCFDNGFLSKINATNCVTDKNDIRPCLKEVTPELVFSILVKNIKC